MGQKALVGLGNAVGLVDELTGEVNKLLDDTNSWRAYVEHTEERYGLWCDIQAA